MFNDCTYSMGFNGDMTIPVQEIIPNFNNYNITPDGRIWSSYHHKWLKPYSTGRYGHLMVTLHKNKIPTKKLVHRLVLETYVGPCPDGMECRHLDGNPRNNDIDNLKWGTHKENMEDKKKHGTSNYADGELARNSKLTEAQVIWIYRSYFSPDGWTQGALADYFNVHTSTINLIINKKTWKHVLEKF